VVIKYTTAPELRRYTTTLNRCTHWRRQLWGTGARAPPRIPASYFGDLNFKRKNTENVQKQRDFRAIFINFWPILSFLSTVFLRE